MKAHLYLWKNEREKYKNQLTDIRDLFFERIVKVFSDSEEQADRFEEELLQIPIQYDYDGDPTGDPGDFFEWVQEKTYDKYVLLEIMNYRTLAMWIACLCQIWEQQNIIFLKRQLKIIGYELVNTKGDGTQIVIEAFSIDTIKRIYKEFNVDITSFTFWSKIVEMRDLVNVIKHG